MQQLQAAPLPKDPYHAQRGVEPSGLVTVTQTTTVSAAPRVLMTTADGVPIYDINASPSRRLLCYSHHARALLPHRISCARRICVAQHVRPLGDLCSAFLSPVRVVALTAMGQPLPS